MAVACSSSSKKEKRLRNRSLRTSEGPGVLDDSSRSLLSCRSFMDGGIVRAWVVAVVFGVLSAAEAGTARGADGAADEAERLIRRGIELRKAQDDQAALKEFQKAYDLTHAPRAAAQLGLAEQAVGRWEDADGHLSEALRAKSDPWVAKNRAALDEALGTVKEHIGRVEVVGDPPGAEVYVNGRLAGRLPLPDPVTVSAGQVDVEVRAPGHQPAARTVSIIGGQYQRVVLRLAKEKSNAPGTGAVVSLPPPGAPPPSAAPPSTAPAPLVSDTPDAGGPSRPRVVAKWSALGLAAAGAGTALVATLLREKNVSDVTDKGCSDRAGQAVDVNGAPMPACQGSLDAAKTDRTLQVLGVGVAGGFAATWLILALTEPKPDRGGEAHASTSLSCTPSVATPGVVCGARF